ncbi:hypothetical protein F8M41_012179 [Gigaspora margarita]|uniref:Uncharacterized protein n=1 Tax=Gigaspora margarita TaxID=4874 RepID=A0A8H3WZB2_GIGMA|nr:hypothetical protein F8M41_012179 [Gigaspora margarita]
MPFKKNFIILLIEHYAYEEAEYVTLVQIVLISFSKRDYILTSEDLLSSFSLLIYSATIVADSYIPDNQGRQKSFMMARQLYNEITNNINVKSKVIVSYKNENNRQNTRQNVNLHNSNNKHLNNKNTSLNFVNIISQVQKGTPSVKTAYTDEEDIAFIRDADPTELVQI